MALFTERDGKFGEAVSGLVYCNPFLPQRISYERAALGDQFDERNALWNIHTGQEDQNPNVARIVKQAEEVLDRARRRLAAGEPPREAELTLYEDLLLFVLYDTWRHGFDQTISQGLTAKEVAVYE
jgi:hypothetical protein